MSKVRSGEVRHRRPLHLVVPLLLGLALVGGCADTEGGEEARTLLFDSPAASPDPPSEPESPAPQPTAEPDRPADVALPESCSDLVRPGKVASALGVRLAGDTTYLFAGPLPDVGRTGRVTCGYGVPSRGKNPTPKAELSLNAYTSADAAEARMAITRDAAAEAGQRVVDAPLRGREGFLLAGADGVSFVVADGARTAVVTVQRGVLPKRAEQAALEELVIDVLGLKRS